MAVNKDGEKRTAGDAFGDEHQETERDDEKNAKMSKLQSHAEAEDEFNLDPVLQEKVQKHIGRCLQDTYGKLVQEPVPDRFLELLKELEGKDKSVDQ